jgi:nickel transport protein
MTRFCMVLIVGGISVWLMTYAVSAAAQARAAENAPELVTLLKEQTGKLSGDLRLIQREIAALRADLEKPGFRDIFSGIGYIFGLFGVAAFVASRRRE